MTGVDDEEFQEMLARAHLARAGLTVAGAPYRELPPAPVVDVELPARPADARCRACDVPMATTLVDRDDFTGLHTGCNEPPIPPSTLDDIHGALTLFENSRPRTVQTTLGPSELGTPCPRQIAMKLAGIVQQPRSLPWAAMCGTAVHSLMEQVLAAENERLGRARWVIEETVNLDAELYGHGDAYDTDHALVVDWKYTGVTARRKAARRSVPNDQLVSAEYRTQAHLYGLGHRNAGRPVRFVRLVLLARSHDFSESVEWTEDYREDIALNAMTRFYFIRDQVTNMEMATHPERLAIVEAVPGDACTWCPFHRPGLTVEVDASGCQGKQSASDQWLATLPTEQ